VIPDDLITGRITADTPESGGCRTNAIQPPSDSGQQAECCGVANSPIPPGEANRTQSGSSYSSSLRERDLVEDLEDPSFYVEYIGVSHVKGIQENAARV